MLKIKGNLKISIPEARKIPEGRADRSTTGKGELGVRIVEVRERTSLLNKDLAGALSDKLGIVIPQSTLFTWIKGRTPRNIQPDKILLALKEIDREFLGKKGNTTWINGDTVSKKLKYWLRTMSEKQIALAANESRQLVSEWKKGIHRVQRRKWLNVCAEVEAMRIAQK